MTEEERILKEVKRTLRSALAILDDESSKPEPTTIRNVATSLTQTGGDLFTLYGQLLSKPKE